MKIFQKAPQMRDDQTRIDEISANYIYITDFHTKPHSCKLINLPHSAGIGIISKIALFKNDHLIIRYKYKGYEFEHEAIVSDTSHNQIALKFLSFSSFEQINLDTLIISALRKRF